MTSTVGEQLLTDMKALDELLGAQRKVASKSSFEAMLKNQFQFMMGKLDHVAGQVSLSEAAAISNALTTSFWSAEQREALAEKVSSCTTLSSNRKARRPLQTLTAFSCYMTSSDKKLLASDAHCMIKVEGIVARCMALGLHLPSEPTVAHIAATMIECGIPAESDQAKWELLKAFKSSLKAKVKHAPQCLQHIAKYPSSPRELPPGIYKTCYGEEGPDSDASPSLGMSSSDIPKRKTNIKIRTTVPGRASTQTDMVMQMWNMMMGRLGGHSSGSRSDVKGLQIFAHTKKQKVLGDVDHPEAQSSSVAATPSTTTLAIVNKPEAVEAVKPEEPPVETDSQQTEVPKSQKNEDLFDLGSMHPNPPKPNNTRAKDNAKLVEEAFTQRESKKNLPQKDATQNLKPAGKAKAKASAKAKAKGSPKALCTPKKTDGVAKGRSKSITPPKPGDGTFHYKNGKIHRNDRSSCWRVFINKSDRCDKKVLFKGDEVSSFRKALAMIEAGK